MSKLVLVQDCREKSGKHNEITDYCKQIGLPIVRRMLNVGDYRLAEMDECGNITYINNVAVDVKSSGKGTDCGIGELANDLYRDKQAFNRKYKKCLQDKIKLIVLVEQEVKSLRELVSWRSKFTKISGRELLDMIDVVRISYGVQFFFVNKEQTGSELIRLLQGDK